MAETRRSSARPTTNHAEIREWAERLGGTPACVKGTGDEDDVGILRIDFPGYGGERKLEPIPWEEWFDEFEENKLALIFRENDRFNKLVSRAQVESRE